MIGMRRVAVSFLLFLICAAQPYANLVITSDCVVGGYFKATVSGFTEGNAATVELRGAAGDTVSKNVLFIPPGSGDGVKSAVVGVPESLKAGAYTVTVLSETGIELESCQISVQARDFRSETISLDESMSRLRLTDNKRRVEEAKELFEIISRKDPEALYHFTPYYTPLDDARITSYFGDRRLFVYTDSTSDKSVHSGIDLAAPEGTPVRSAGRGVVVFAGDRLISGYSVVIEHLPGVFSLYYHLSALSVQEGDFVAEKEIIGTLGSTGLATGPHLHWEFRIGGVCVDPDLMTGFSL